LDANLAQVVTEAATYDTLRGSTAGGAYGAATECSDVSTATKAARQPADDTPQKIDFKSMYDDVKNGNALQRCISVHSDGQQYHTL
jgi:hypothetical protein